MNDEQQLPEVAVVPTSSLIPAPYSLERDMRGPQYDHVLAGVSALGCIVYPIIVDKDMNVIDGHRRLRVAQTLDMEEVPIQYYDGELSNVELYKKLNDLQEPLTAEQARYVRSYKPRNDEERRLLNAYKALNEMPDATEDEEE